jgi:hypothetical protein
VEEIWNKPGTDPEGNWKNLFIINKSHFSYQLIKNVQLMSFNLFTRYFELQIFKKLERGVL